jgi:hypothetical protein
VVDNASADGSADMVAEVFADVHLLRSPDNLGFSGGNNLALSKATGRYLLILNSDTRVESGALGAMVDYADAHPDVGAVGPRLEDAEGRLELSCGRCPGITAEIVHKLLLHRVFPFYRFGRWHHRNSRDVGWVTGACLMVRHEATRTAGLLDDGMFMCHEDVDWCLRLRRTGWRVVYLPHSRVIHLEGQSIRKRMTEMLVVSQQSQFYLFQKHFGGAHLQLLRLLTTVEMGLRSMLWACFWLLRPTSRPQAGERLAAYRRILIRTLTDRTFWAPRDTPRWVPR